MSSSTDMQSIMEYLWFSNSAAVVVLTAIVYDYLLVLPREIDYIWCRRWTLVSTLFVLVRYLGLCYSVTWGYSYNNFFPNSAIARIFKGLVVTEICEWTLKLFFLAADLVMVLRVYAMWNRSKIILCVLLFLYMSQGLISLVFTGVFYGSSTYLSVSIFQILNISLCVSSLNLPSPLWSYGIPRYILMVVLLALAVIQTLKQSFNMYKVTKRWQPNQYLELFVREGLIYYLLRLLYDITGIVNSPSTLMVFVDASIIVSMFSVLPRFIIGMREMYEHDLSRHSRDIDTGFGVQLQSTGGGTVMSAIAFADVAAGQNQFVEGEADDSEMIRLDVFGEGSASYPARGGQSQHEAY